MDIPNEYKKNLYMGSLALLVVLSLFFAMRFLSEVKSYTSRGSGDANVITLSGHGEVQAVPDIASIYFTVETSSATQGTASEEVNKKTKNIIDFLKTSGVEEKDIKTENYNSYPKYSNPEVCPMYYPIDGGVPPCRGGESKVVGYTVSQSVSVKVRKVDDASKIIDGINKIGVNNMSGPNFTIDDEDALKAEARREAIADARTKAEALAKDLGIKLGRVSNFSENTGGYYPMFSKVGYEMDGSARNQSAPAELPKGENTISSDVTISYEIR